ncbi:hypothetical protein HG531_007848 [Fusarium graminearum]|nr:hypothetical protein HG531_007848 [Fusarium graminearum]
MIFEALRLEICPDGTASSARKMLDVPTSATFDTSEKDVPSVVNELRGDRSDWINAIIFLAKLLFLPGCFLLGKGSAATTRSFTCLTHVVLGSVVVLLAGDLYAEFALQDKAILANLCHHVLTSAARTDAGPVK